MPGQKQRGIHDTGGILAMLGKSGSFPLMPKRPEYCLRVFKGNTSFGGNITEDLDLLATCPF